jgi:hypothetical protein
MDNNMAVENRGCGGKAGEAVMLMHSRSRGKDVVGEIRCVHAFVAHMICITCVSVKTEL